MSIDGEPPLPPISQLFDLSGRVAIVSGAGRGFGRAFCRALGEAGASVACVDSETEAADETGQLVRDAGGTGVARGVDVTVAESVRSTVEATVDEFGRLDILVNNAGINIGNDTPAERLPLDVWNQVIATNLTGYFTFAQAAARPMIRQRSGRVVNIASAAAVNPPRLQGRSTNAYAVSKAGVVMLTKTLALDWARYGITVNALSPTYSNTGLITRDPVRMEQMLATSPFGRLGEPGDLIGALIYLCSDASAFMTGANLCVDGGYTI